MKKVIFALLFVGFCGSAIAQTEESQMLNQMKSAACSGDKKCESYFVSAVGMSSMISRYHGECLADSDTSTQCKDAERTYKDIQSEYEKDKKSRN